MTKVFNIFHKEYNGDEPIKVEGHDHESAAEAYAEEYDSDQASLLEKYTPILIEVQNATDGGPRKAFKIWAEASVNYYADEVFPAPEGSVNKTEGV